MHELTAAERDADMRRSFVHGLEEDEVANLDVLVFGKDAFGTAPRELTRSITLRHTLDLVRSVVDVVEQDATALLNGCLWRVSERDGKALPGTMDYREERRNLGIQSGKVIWVRRG